MDHVWRWLGDNSLELIGLLATLVLLLVTYLATRAAQDMAKIARDSAADSARATAAAERSAQAAHDAALVAQSQIRVEFEGRLIALWEEGEDHHVPTVEIQSVGDPVVVQRVRVRRAFRVSNEDDEYRRRTYHDPDLSEVELVCAGESTLPRRLHRGERLHLTHPAMATEGDRLDRYILEVDYSFSEHGGAGATRQLIVTHPRG